MRRFAILLVVGVVFAGCSKEPKKRVTCDGVKDAVRGIFRLENSVVSKGRRPVITPVDVEGLSAKDLERKLRRFHPENSHLWMPGEKSWLVVEHPETNRISLAAAMDAFAGDEKLTLSLPEVFSSYAGKIKDVLPAFDSELKGEVVPQWFVSRDVPGIDWIDESGVDKDILGKVLSGINTAQRARRTLLEGNILALSAKDKEGERLAIEKWSMAYGMCPRDPMMSERLGNLERNGKGFMAVGKLLQAMKCYETIILINPEDSVAILNFGMCLKKIGRIDMAEKVFSEVERRRKSCSD